MKRHALLVGINKWEDKRIQPLRCAERDAREMAGLFHRLQFEIVRPLIGPEATLGSVIDQLRHCADGLGTEDLFVFYFAGHGTTQGAAHDLFCWDARPGSNAPDCRPGLLALHSAIGLLRECGVFHRLLITDACRNDWEAGRSGTDLPFRGSGSFRNLGESDATGTASLVLLNSCEDGKRARELDDHGLLTQAVLDLGRSKVDARIPLWINADFRDELGRRMQDLAEGHGFDREEQWPLWVEGRPLPFALDGSRTEPSLDGHPALPARPASPRRPPRSSTISGGAADEHERASSEHCAACGKGFLTQLDRVGACQYSDCVKPICNHCWTVLGDRLCREHRARRS